MGTHRMMPPPSGPNTINVNGRTYTCASGATIDVPDFDGEVMKANGWTAAADGGCGTTTTRPVYAKNTNVGAEFHDTTLGYVIKWDGQKWRNPSTGAAV